MTSYLGIYYKSTVSIDSTNKTIYFDSNKKQVPISAVIVSVASVHQANSLGIQIGDIIESIQNF